MQNVAPQLEFKENIILVADDDFYMRSLVKVAFEGRATVIEAATAEEVLPLYKEHKPDVVLLDIHFPQKSGKEILQELLEFDPSAWVTMISADSISDNVLHTTHAGAKGFIVKPFTKVTLMKYVLACPTIQPHSAD